MAKHTIQLSDLANHCTRDSLASCSSGKRLTLLVRPVSKQVRFLVEVKGVSEISNPTLNREFDELGEAIAYYNSPDKTMTGHKISLSDLAAHSTRESLASCSEGGGKRLTLCCLPLSKQVHFLAEVKTVADWIGSETLKRLGFDPNQNVQLNLSRQFDELGEAIAYYNEA
jgi:hypothetical protein